MRTVLNLCTLAFVLALAGCSTPPSGRGSRILPWNWFAPDRATQLTEAEGDTSKVEAKLVRAAHVEFSKLVIALELAEASEPVLLARRFAGNGFALLNQVTPLPAQEAADARSLVADLLSTDPAKVAAAERTQAHDEKANAKTGAELERLRAREQELTAKLLESDRRYQAEAEKYRRVMFWIIAGVSAWILLQVVSGLARFYPPLAPVARLAGSVIAPAVQASYERVTSAVGKAISDAEKLGPATAETLRQFIDPHADTADQEIIKAKYNAAP